MKVTFRCLPRLEPILPKPLPAKRATPDWLKDMPMTAFVETTGAKIQTVKQCPPFIDAMTSGFVVPLPCDVSYKDGRFDWKWDEFPGMTPAFSGRSPLTYHYPDQVTGTPLFVKDRAVLKFVSFWTFEVEEGYSLLYTHPFNRYDLPFRAFTGIVDNDSFAGEYVHFPAAWVDDDFEGTLKKGTPIVQVVPVRRDDLAMEMDFGTVDPEQAKQLTHSADMIKNTSGYYKKNFRVKKP